MRMRLTLCNSQTLQVFRTSRIRPFEPSLPPHKAFSATVDYTNQGEASFTPTANLICRLWKECSADLGWLDQAKPAFMTVS